MLSRLGIKSWVFVTPSNVPYLIIWIEWQETSAVFNQDGGRGTGSVGDVINMDAAEKSVGEGMRRKRRWVGREIREG